jgi:surfactin synthase thioesterase subunit
MGTMTSSKWFRSLLPLPDARFRLFCFPHAGGSVATYRSWPRHLPSDVEVCAVQLPGRDVRMRDEPITEMPRLVDELAEGLASSLERPHAFFGHSMGAIIAFELVRRLRRQARPLPVHLFVSARSAPQIVDGKPPCHDLPEADFVNHLVERYNGIPQPILAEPELMRLFLPILRADFKLIENYRYQPGETLEQPVTAFGGAEDPIVTSAELGAWRDVTHGAFHLHMMSGGHFFLQSSEAELARLIANELRSM